MKHVREDLPDVQTLRPEVSANLASILDRMTDKDLARRYPDCGGARRRPRGRAGDRGRARRALDRRGDRGPAHAARLHAPAAALPDAPLGARAAGRRSCSAAAGAGVAYLLKEGVDRTQRGTGVGQVDARAADGDRLGRRDRPPRTTTRWATTASTRRAARSRSTRTPAPRGRPRATGRHADQGRRRPLRRRHARRGRARDRDHDPARPAGRRRSTPPARGRRSSSRPPAGTEVGGGTRAARATSASRSTPPASATATSSCGSPSCRRSRTASRSPRSRSSSASGSERGRLEPVAAALGLPALER